LVGVSWTKGISNRLQLSKSQQVTGYLNMGVPGQLCV
jgi:hypothetical protein